MAEKEDFFDELILEYRRRARKEKYSTLESGMYIKDELVQFERRDLFQGKMSIMLPDSFVDLPSNMAKFKYTSEQRPQVIKTSLDTTVNIGFTLLNQEIKEEQVGILLDQAKEALKRMNPALAFYKNGVEDGRVKSGWFDFKSYALDSHVYNLMFIARVEGKMVHGIFNCPFEDALEWRDAACQMIKSIEDTAIMEEKKDAGTDN